MKPASSRHGAVVALGLAVAANAGAIDAAECRAASGTGTTPLVELYTSEGCDSCPAADRWLAAGFLHGAGASAPAALAFHVDYWDRLGWIDRFASPAWTERQYAAMRANRASFVYTPQFLLQGRDFGDWRRGTASAALNEIAARPARATIEIAATPDADGVAAIATGKLTDAKSGGGATLSIAYVDSGLVSDVRAGENRGARLTHDHVVRALRTTEPVGRGGTLALSARFSRPAEAGSVPTLVAFVQSAQDGDVLQALALRLSDCER